MEEISNIAKDILKSRKNKKGLSGAVISGAVTALMLLIASILTTLIVVSFAFSFLSFANTPLVKQNGPAYIDNSGDHYSLEVVLSSTGTVTIDSIAINGHLESANIVIKPGIKELNINLPNDAKLDQGDIYVVTLGLSNGFSVPISAIYN